MNRSAAPSIPCPRADEVDRVLRMGWFQQVHAKWMPLYRCCLKNLSSAISKKTPEYRNVMLRADQHAEWLAGLAGLSAPPVSSTERTDTLDAPQKAALNKAGY